jgi:hypothetical protein
MPEDLELENTVRNVVHNVTKAGNLELVLPSTNHNTKAHILAALSPLA